MDSFSIGGAWSFGFRFFGQRPAVHLLVLVGLGIILPVALQFALLGRLTGANAPLLGGSQPALAGGAFMVVVQILACVLQLASYFASWRLGFAGGERLPGALLFGALAALVATLV